MHVYFRNLMDTLGLQKNVQDFIIAEMTAPHRHYHTLGHLALMLKTIGYRPIYKDGMFIGLFEDKYGNPNDANNLAVATLFHDIVYDPKATDNEEQSVAVAKLWLNHRSWDLSLIEQLIMVTKDHNLGNWRKPELEYRMIYADLSILWSDWNQYDWYSKGVRKEYAWVPAEQYREGRTKVLHEIQSNLVQALNHDNDAILRLGRNVSWEIERLADGDFDTP